MRIICSNSENIILIGVCHSESSTSCSNFTCLCYVIATTRIHLPNHVSLLLRQNVESSGTKYHTSVCYAWKFIHWIQLPWYIRTSNQSKKFCDTIMRRGVKKQLESIKGRKRRVHLIKGRIHGLFKDLFTGCKKSVVSGVSLTSGC